MATFNLKKMAKKDDHDDHIERRLKKEHKPDPESITEKQLEDYVIDDGGPQSLTEKQLDSKRHASEGTIEARLNESKSTLVKHRDESTHIGDINKLEEQRLAKKPVEKEKYTPASETPKPFRWWEEKSSPDGLKLAQYESAFGRPRFDAFDEEGDLSDKFMSDDDFGIDEVDGDMGDEDFFDNPDDEDIDSELEGIDLDEFGIEDVDDSIELDDGDLLEKPQMEELAFENNTDLSIMRGKVQVSGLGDTEDIENNGPVIHAILDFISEKHPHISGALSPDSLDFSKVDEGIVRYMVQDREGKGASSTKRTVQSALPVKKK